MQPAKTATAKRAEIVRFYKKATYCYLAPFILLLFCFVVPFFGALWLPTLPLCSLLGLFFTQRGLALAVKSKDREKKDVGYANLVLGVIILLASLLGLGFAYAMMSKGPVTHTSRYSLPTAQL